MSLYESYKQALRAIFRFDNNNNLKITIAGDEVNIAKEDTVSAIKAQTDKLQFDTNNFLRIALASDEVNLAKESTLSSMLSQLDIKLSELRDALKPARTSPTQDLSAHTIEAGSTAEITKSGLNGYSAIVAIVKATYDPSATAGVRVRWLYSPDGSNFDSPEDAENQGNYEDLTFSAGATRQRTILIPILCDNVKIQIVNLDTSYAVTVDAWTLLMR